MKIVKSSIGDYIEVELNEFLEEVKKDNLKAFWVDGPNFSIEKMKRLGDVRLEHFEVDSINQIEIYVNDIQLGFISLANSKSIQYYTK